VKKYFDEQGFTGKLPSINSLKKEYAATLAEKKKLYSDYNALKEKHAALGVARVNAESILGITSDGQTREPERTTAEKKTYGYGVR
jgi:hypothetical protein